MHEKSYHEQAIYKLNRIYPKNILDNHFFYDILDLCFSFAVVMELVDVVDSTSTGGDTVPVRVRSTAVFCFILCLRIYFFDLSLKK